MITNSGKSARIHALVHSILDFLKENSSAAPEVIQVLDRLKSMDLSLASTLDCAPCGTRHEHVLSKAIEGITSPNLRGIANSLDQARDDVVWREDNAQFYAPDANLGEGYRNCNLHTLLIGPDACGYEAQDFCLGLFMLGSRTLYRDHAHDAPELYINLASRSGWRLSSGAWQDYGAGSVIWNDPGQSHAIRTYDHPFLSIFIWLENIDSICRVVPVSDWEEIENNLAHSEL